MSNASQTLIRGGQGFVDLPKRSAYWNGEFIGWHLRLLVVMERRKAFRVTEFKCQTIPRPIRNGFPFALVVPTTGNRPKKS